MLSPIESLPVELFDTISAELSTQDCQSLRLTSRQLHRLIHADFVRRAFSEQSTTLSPSSLERLVNVSSHRGFRDAVKCLHIRVLSHQEYENLIAISRVGRFPPPKRFHRVSHVRDKHINDEVATYAYVTNNERPTQLYNGLLRALEGLSSLKAIRFSTKQHRPFTFGLDESPHALFRNRCFEAIVFAIGHSKIKLDEFSMGRKKGRKMMYKPLDVSYSAFQLAPASLQTLRYCFSNLQSLRLSIEIGCSTPHPDNWAKNISDFIGSAPRLRSLAFSLNRVLNKHNQISHYSCIMVKSLAISCRLPNLETLEMMNCTLHGKDLSDLVRAHSSSLQCIVFSSIRLLTERWCSMAGTLKACQRLKYFRLSAAEDPWSIVFPTARLQDEPYLAWDSRKNNHSVFDWFQGVTAIDPSADQTYHHIPTNDNIDAESTVANHHD